jgi:hypothetical protein
MREIVRIADHHVVAQVTTDDCAVVKSNRHPEIVKFEVIGFKLSNSHQAEEFAIPHEVGIESIRNQELVPIIGCVLIPDQYLNFLGIQMPVFDPTAVLNISKMIFIFPFG